MLSGCSRGLEQRRAWTNREREVSMAGDFGILWQKDDAIIYIYKLLQVIPCGLVT